MPKRRRTDAYHDDINPLQDYDMIHTSEAALRNIGGSMRTARIERSPQRAVGAWEQVLTWSPQDDTNFALDVDGEWYDETVETPVMEELQPPMVVKTKTKRSMVSKRPHVVWKNLHRQAYLDEIVRWAGRGDFRHSEACPDCIARSVEVPSSPEYRCRDCISPDLTCQICCAKRHRLHPFHRVDHWTGSSFVEVSLQSLGVKLQLNHSGSYCDNPLPCHASMLILHTNGIHSVNVLYCGCSRAIPNHLQLLRRRLYPASQLLVKTCATFELLRHLHKLALTTKASTYDFYRCLEKSTTNLGINPPKSRYRALFRMILQWRHLQMLKWGGRGHDVTGAAGTVDGELAIKCPSCPHPGVNLPDNWENVADDMKFLYMTIICMDANFRLKNQMVSNYSQDPGLGIGWAYMVPRSGYEAYVLSRANDKDISTCVGFQALAKANTKFSVGLRYTGVGATVCGRTEMIFPTGVGNLQKGERYANMDYIFGMILKAIAVHLVLISYDIACQWFINLLKRIQDEWPPEIKPPANIHLTPAIPKLHEPMHTQANHQLYSLNFIPGVGMSDCECPERVWAPHNSLSNATKTQGPGSRQDTLDDHFGFWNWLKYVSLGTSLLRRYKNAVADRNIQSEGHRGLSNSLDAGLVAKWEAMCKAWEDAPFPKKKMKNPYHMVDSSLSEAQIKKELADEETVHLANGGTFPHTTTASMFIALGLDLEEAQRRIRRLAKNAGPHSTLRQAGSLSEQRNVLSSRIRGWEQLLPIYIPGMLQYQTDHPRSAASTNAEDTILWLPSAIPEPHRARITTPNLTKMEGKLRLAQLTDSLNAIRQILKVKSRMILFKNRNIRGQKDGTRSTSVIDRVHERARFAAAKYRAARIAHMALVGPGDWEQQFRVLEDKDIRGYQDENQLRVRTGRRGTLEDDQIQDDGDVRQEQGEFELFNELRTRRQGTGQARRTLSWIWTSGSNVPGPDDDKDDILRVEWAKSRARSTRTKEEVLLLKEEMRRTLAFLDWKSTWWRDRRIARPRESKDLLEGISAFAVSQAGVQDSLRAHFQRLWRAPLDELSTGEDSTNNSDDEEDEDEEDEEEVEVEENDGDGDFEDDN